MTVQPKMVLEETETFQTVEDLRAAKYEMHGPPVAVVALDPSGAGDDRNSIVIVERELWRRGELHDPILSVIRRFILRGAWILDRDATFTQVLGAMMSTHRNLIKHENKNKVLNHFMAVETNGIGWPFYSALADKIGGSKVMAITTTGGTKATVRESQGWTMPRQAGLDNLQALMELYTFKVHRDAPGRKLVEHEMNAFVWKSQKPQATAGEHDDTVMALTIATWVASQILPLEIVPETPKDHSIASFYTGVGHG